MGVLEYLNGTHQTLKDGLNALSLAAGCIVVVLISLTAIRGYRLVNRTTFRIQAGIAIADIIRHIHLYAIARILEEGFLCKLSPFLYMFFTHVFILLNIAVALNLHLVILLDIRPSYKWQRYYWIVSFIFPAIVNIAALAQDVYGKVEYGCDTTKKNTIFWKSILDLFPISFGLTYCVAVTVVLVYKLYNTAEKVVAERTSDNKDCPYETALLLQEVRNTVYKVGLYPAAFFISLSGNLAFELYINTIGTKNNTYYILNIWSSFSLRSSGLLNLAAFISDLTFNTAIYLIFKPNGYVFDQPYKLDQLNDTPTHDFNINRSDNDLDNSRNRQIYFRKKDQHLGPMDVDEYVSLL